MLLTIFAAISIGARIRSLLKSRNDTSGSWSKILKSLALQQIRSLQRQTDLSTHVRDSSKKDEAFLKLGSVRPYVRNG